MTRFGYTLMTEQSGPKELVRYAQAAEDVGFDLAVSSDHYSPWLSAQGSAPPPRSSSRGRVRLSGHPIKRRFAGEQLSREASLYRVTR